MNWTPPTILRLIGSILASGALAARAEKINFISVSDLHYGITRNFNGDAAASGQKVNRAMIAKMNAVPGLAVPGLALPGGGTVGPIEFVTITGDIANRAESGIQQAAVSWGQFQGDYLGGNWNTAGGLLTLTDKTGKATRLYLTPGNHDLSNAIGMTDTIATPDATSMVEIHNRMADPDGTRPGARIGASAYRDRDWPAKGSLNYSADVGGMHLVFINMWPDRNIQAWMDRDLSKVGSTTPVLLFAHAPIGLTETKVFRDPAEPNTPTSSYAGNIPFTISKPGYPGQYASTAAARDELVSWLGKHPQIKAYFAGHNNVCKSTAVPTSGGNHVQEFRIDSPMKGHVSASDERVLSFDVCTFDSTARTLTVREYLWNDQSGATTTGAWGQSTTISLLISP